MSLQAFARDFVDQSLRTNPPRRMYVGGGASFIAWVSALVPTALLENVIAKYLGLHELTNIYALESKSK